MAAAISLEAGGGLAHDLGSAAVTAGVALALLKFFEELAKRGVFEQVSPATPFVYRVAPSFCAYLRRFSATTRLLVVASEFPSVLALRKPLLHYTDKRIVTETSWE